MKILSWNTLIATFLWWVLGWVVGCVVLSFYEMRRPISTAGKSEKKAARSAMIQAASGVGVFVAAMWLLWHVRGGV